MSDLVVLAFANEVDAIKMRSKLFELNQERLIQLIDAVFVVRKPDGKMIVKHEGRLADTSTYQGLLLAFIYWMFYQEIAASGTLGAPNNLQGYIGVDVKFVSDIRRILKPGYAALFLLAAKFSKYKVMDHVQDLNATLLKTSLSKTDEALLMAVFGR